MAIVAAATISQMGHVLAKKSAKSAPKSAPSARTLARAAVLLPTTRACSCSDLGALLVVHRVVTDPPPFVVLELVVNRLVNLALPVVGAVSCHIARNVL